MSTHTNRGRQPDGLPPCFTPWPHRLARGIGTAVLVAGLMCSGAAGSRAEIIIGAAGSAEPAGNPAAAVRIGVELAVAGLAAAGKPGREAIRIVTADDQCNAAGAEAAAKSLVAGGATLVIGHVCSSAAIAAAPMYRDARIIFMSPGARNPKLTDERAGPGVFRLAGRNDRQAADIAAAIIARYAGKKAAIVNDKDPQSRDLADAVHRALTAAGFPVVHRESYSPGEKDLAELVRRLKIADSDIVFVPAQPHDLAIILAQMRTQSLDAHVIGSDLLAVPAVIPAADLAGEALSVMLAWAPKPSDSAVERVQPILQLGREAQTVALQAYAAVEAWAQARGESGEDFNKVAAALSAKEFDTVIGRLRFNDHGDANIPSYALNAWRDGTWHRLK